MWNTKNAKERAKMYEKRKKTKKQKKIGSSRDYMVLHFLLSLPFRFAIKGYPSSGPRSPPSDFISRKSPKLKKPYVCI